MARGKHEVELLSPVSTIPRMPSKKNSDLANEFLAAVPIHYHRLVKIVTRWSDCVAILDMLVH